MNILLTDNYTLFSFFFLGRRREFVSEHPDYCCVVSALVWCSLSVFLVRYYFFLDRSGLCADKKVRINYGERSPFQYFLLLFSSNYIYFLSMLVSFNLFFNQYYQVISFVILGYESASKALCALTLGSDANLPSY